MLDQEGRQVSARELADTLPTVEQELVPVVIVKGRARLRLEGRRPARMAVAGRDVLGGGVGLGAGQRRLLDREVRRVAGR